MYNDTEHKAVNPQVPELDIPMCIRASPREGIFVSDIPWGQAYCGGGPREFLSV